MKYDGQVQAVEVNVRVRRVKPRPESRVTGNLAACPFPKHEPDVYVGPVTLTDVDVSRQRFGYFSAAGATFIRFRFDRTTIVDGDLGSLFSEASQTGYIDCSFDRASLTMMPGNAPFERCRFTNIKGSGWRACEVSCPGISIEEVVTTLEALERVVDRRGMWP